MLDEAVRIVGTNTGTAGLTDIALLALNEREDQGMSGGHA